SRLQEDMKRVEGLAPAPQGRAAGRHYQDGSGGGRYVPLHPFIQQVQFLWRPGKKDEPVVGDGGRVESRARDRTVASRLQPRPPQPVARRGRRAREKLEPVQGSDRVAGLRLFLSHHLHLPDESSRWHRLVVRSSAGSSARHGTPWAEFVNTTLSILGRLGLVPQPAAGHVLRIRRATEITLQPRAPIPRTIHSDCPVLSGCPILQRKSAPELESGALCD